MLIILGISFYIGAIFGSFSTVLIERWHSGKGGILMGRSECPHCNTILQAKDLFPIFSYLWNRGKCSHCKKNISSFYLIAEITMGAIFAILTYAAIVFEIGVLDIHGLILILFGFITGVYILYDIRYMEIPDQIMIPALYLTLIIPFLFVLFSGQTEYTFHISLQSRFIGALILYTFFYIQILIPGGLYLIKHRKWRTFGELILNYFTFPIELLISIFRKNSQKKDDDIDLPTWIGGGDLRIALFIGLTLGTLHGVASFAFAYIIGSIIGICLLTYNAIRRKKTESQIPFGPFLGIGWILSIVFYREIEIFYHIFFI